MFSISLVRTHFTVFVQPKSHKRVQLQIYRKGYRIATEWDTHFQNFNWIVKYSCESIELDSDKHKSFDFNFVGRFMFDCCMIKGEIFFPKLVSSFHLLHATSHLYCVVRYFTLVLCIFSSLFGSGYRIGSTECVTNISKYSIPCYTSFSLLSLNFSTNTDIWPNIIHAIQSHMRICSRWG